MLTLDEETLLELGYGEEKAYIASAKYFTKIHEQKKLYDRKYSKTLNGKIRNKKYRESEKGRLTTKNYQKTDNYKNSIKKYQNSEKGFVVKNRYLAKIKARKLLEKANKPKPKPLTPKERIAKFLKTPKGKAYIKEKNRKYKLKRKALKLLNLKLIET
jgi:hypothetical protein